MFCLSSKKRYFEMRGPAGKILHIEPPKLSALNQLASMDDNSTPAECAAVLAAFISRNREGFKMSPEKVMDWMDSDQMAEFLAAYLGWVNDTRQQDPN